MTTYDFSGKTVIITGAFGDIGKATAARFLEAGANVVVNYNRTVKEDVRDMLTAIAPDRVLFAQADISKWEDDERIVRETIDRFGRIDVLVNNAGINAQAPQRAPFHKFDRAFWDKIMSIDVNGTFYLSQIVANRMIEQGEGGSIVNISSIMGVNPTRMQCAFTVAKAGVIMMSRVMALELAEFGIRVNCLCPGSIMTEKTYKKFYSDPVKTAGLLSHVPMKRPGNTDEIAYGIMYLASSDSAYTTGDNLIIDGGWMCGYTQEWE